MKENHAAENALGTIGAILWMVQILPQIIKSHREKTTKGLSASLMFIWALASLFLGAYIVAQKLSIPLQVQRNTIHDGYLRSSPNPEACS